MRLPHAVHGSIYANEINQKETFKQTDEDGGT